MKKKKMEKWFSITSKDCVFQTYRGSGKGGQHRNKTDSAVRCIHEPSEAVGTCKEYRKQKKNKQIAFKRMAESAKFQSWIKFKIDVGLGKVEIQEGNAPARKLNLEEV